MNTKQFTTEQLVSMWEDRRAIMNIMGIFSAHYLLKLEKSLYADLFAAKAEDVSLAVNDGWYLGSEAVAGYFNALHEKTALISKLIKAKYPEKLGGKSDEEVYGVGMIDYKPLDTPVVEVAWDGLTAKGLWFCRDSYDTLTAGGPVAYHTWGFIAADFIKEDGKWKIWHMQMLDDVHVRAGMQYYEADKPYPDVPGFEAMKDFKMPRPTVKTAVRPLYSTDRPLTLAPKLPESFDTFANTFTYGYIKEA